MCLWYGGTAKHNSIIKVQPIGQAVDPDEGESSAAAEGKKNYDSLSDLISVKRSALVPLDEEILYSRCKNTTHRDFGLALLLFAEWDDYARDSYVWPDFISRLIGSRNGLECWFKMSNMHPLANRAGTQENRVKYYFFLLCAEHRGITGEYMATDRFIRGERVDSCSLEVLDLITHISRQKLGTCDTRSTSRSGKQYQAVITSKISKDGARQDVNPDASSGSLPIWQPDQLTEDSVQKFLTAVMAERLASVRVGQLLEAPTAEWIRQRSTGQTNGSPCSGFDALVSKIPRSNPELDKVVSGASLDMSLTGEASPYGSSRSESPPSAMGSVLATSSTDGCDELCVTSAEDAGSAGEPVLGLETGKDAIGSDAELLPPTPVPAPDLSAAELSLRAKQRSVQRSVTCCVIHKGKMVPITASEPIYSAPVVQVQAQAISAVTTTDPVQGPEQCIVAAPDMAHIENCMNADVPLVTPEPNVGMPSIGKDDAPVPAKASSATPEYTIDENADQHGVWVTVYDGCSQWSAPLNMCRLYAMSDDAALTILSSHGYDTDKALAEIRAALEATEGGDLLSNQAGFTRADMDMFLQIAQRHRRNIRKIWMRFNARNDAIKEQGKEKVEVPYVSVPVTASVMGCSTRVVTLREMMDLYFLMFQGISDGEEVSGGASNSSDLRILSRHSSTTRYDYWVNANNDHRQATELAMAKYQQTPQDYAHIYQRAPCQSKRWPPTFPMNKYNIYWVRSNNQPCVCVDFDPERQMVKIVPICCATYHHEIQVGVSSICPISAHLFKDCPDERAASFAMAMMDFAKWELSTLEIPVCRWYQYPKFIMRFFSHGPTFSSWRKTAERIVRGSNVDKRKVYFDKLMEDYIAAGADESDRLNQLHHFPFEDAENLSSGDEVSDSSEEEEEERPTPRNAEKPKKDRSKTSKDKDSAVKVQKKRVRSKASKESEVSREPEPILESPLSNDYNLFWSPKSNLPCLFYDRVQNLHQWTISVIPICCTTYHYKVTALRATGQLESLTWKHMDLCTDERTTDFTFAMMDFADWHRARLGRIEANGTGPLCDVNVWGSVHPIVDGVYMWPRFIVEMVEKPKVWALWRKKAERANTNGMSRRLAYLAALCADFHDHSHEFLSLPPSARVVLNIKPDKPGPRDPSSHSRLKEAVARKPIDKENQSDRPEKSVKRQKPLKDKADTREVETNVAVRVSDKEKSVPLHTLLKFEDSGISTMDDAESDREDISSRKRSREDVV